MATTSPKSFVPNSKDVRYLNRDFTQLKTSLLEFAKTYFPNSYKDFSPSSPGTMFIEMAAYVGDVLSYYTDYAFKEGLIQNSTERKNILALAKYLGYRVKPSQGATGYVDIFQLCPSIENENGTYIPNIDYALKIRENMQVSNNVNSFYILGEFVDFAVSTSLSPRTDTVYSRNPNGTPEFFLLQKEGKIASGQIFTKEFTVNGPVSFQKFYLDETDVLGVLEVVDSDNNEWHEVDYLAQELVPISVPNDVEHEGTLNEYRDSVPYILKYLKTPRRFTVNVDAENQTYLEFGAGTGGFEEEFVTFDPKLVGIGLQNISTYHVPIDPANFINGKTYGIAPSNTSLTVRYIIGGGLESNAASNDIRTVASAEFDNPTEGLTPEKIDLLNTVKNSLQVNNPEPITGGKGGESDEEIKLNALAHFATQNRAVTRDDYLVRIYSLPSKFGSIAKAQVVTEQSLDVDVKKIALGTINMENSALVEVPSLDAYFRKLTYDVSNPFAINVYLLSYDSNKNLVSANDALLTNLISYLKKFRMMTDGINLIDGYIINIGIDFAITVFKGYNKKEVLSECIDTVQDFFNIDNWNFSQPINLSQLQLEIAKVEGVQSVVNVKVTNKTIVDGNYSAVEYDINSATKNGIIYPSVDPSIFEIRFPGSDIKGTVI